MLIKNEQRGMQKYWKVIGGESLSSEFKELFLKMVHINPSQRPKIEEIYNGSWL